MDDQPLKAFLEALTRSLARPRTVVRALIAARPDGTERLMLVGLGAALQGMMWGLVGLLAPSSVGGMLAQGIGLVGHVALAGLAFLNYVFVATLAHFIGRAFGGLGRPNEVATAVAWHTVLSAALTPLQALALGAGAPLPGPDAAQPQGGGLSVLLLGFYIGYNLWLLGSCIAEAHGFRSTGRVVAATAGVAFSVGMTLLIVFALFRI